MSAYAKMIFFSKISLAHALMLIGRPVHYKAFSSFRCCFYDLCLLYSLYEPFKVFLRLPVNVGKVCIQSAACEKIHVILNVRKIRPTSVVHNVVGEAVTDFHVFIV